MTGTSLVRDFGDFPPMKRGLVVNFPNLPPRPPDTLMMSIARTQVTRPPGESASLFFPGGVSNEGMERVVADYDRAITQAQILALEFAVQVLTQANEDIGADYVQGIIDSLRRSSPVALTDE